MRKRTVSWVIFLLFALLVTAVVQVLAAKGYLTEWVAKCFGVDGEWVVIIGVGFSVAALPLSIIFNAIWKKLFNSERPEDKARQDVINKKYTEFVSNGTVRCINLEEENSEDIIYVDPKLYTKDGSRRLAAAKKIASWRSKDSDFIVLYSDAPSGKQKLAIKSVAPKLFPVYLVKDATGEVEKISDIVRTIAEHAADKSFTFIINCEKSLKAEDVSKIRSDIYNVRSNLGKIKTRVVLIMRYPGTLNEDWEYKIDCLDDNEIMAFAKEFSSICNERKIGDPLAIIQSRHDNATGIKLTRVSGGNPAQLAKYLYRVAKEEEYTYVSPSSAFAKLLRKRTKKIELDGETCLRFHAILHFLVTLRLDGGTFDVKLCSLKGVWGDDWFEKHSMKLKDYLVAAGFWGGRIELYENFPIYHGSESEKKLLEHFASCCGKYYEGSSAVGFYDQWVELSKWLWTNIRPVAGRYWTAIIDAAVDYWLKVKVPDEAETYTIYNRLWHMREDIIADLGNQQIKDEANVLCKQLKFNTSKLVDDFLAQNAARMSSKSLIDICYQELYACSCGLYSAARDFVFRFSEVLPYLWKASDNPLVWWWKLDDIKNIFDIALKVNDSDAEVGDRIYAIAFAIERLLLFGHPIIEYYGVDEWRQYLSGLMGSLKNDGKRGKVLLSCIEILQNLKHEDGPIATDVMAKGYKAAMAAIQLPNDYGAALYTIAAFHVMDFIIPADNGEADGFVKKISVLPDSLPSSLRFFRDQLLQRVILQVARPLVADINPETIASVFDSIKTRIDCLGAQAGISFENSSLALNTLIGVYNSLSRMFGTKKEYEDVLATLKDSLEKEVLARYESFSYDEWCEIMSMRFVSLESLSKGQQKAFNYHWKELLDRICRSGTSEIMISDNELRLFVYFAATVYNTATAYNDKRFLNEYGNKMLDAVFKNNLFYFVTPEWKEKWLEQAALPFAYSCFPLYMWFLIKDVVFYVGTVFEHGELPNETQTLLQKWLVIPDDTKKHFVYWFSKGIESLRNNFHSIISSKGLDAALNCIANTQEVVYCFALPFAYAWFNSLGNDKKDSNVVNLDGTTEDVIYEIFFLIDLFNGKRVSYDSVFSKALECVDGWKAGLDALDEFLQSDVYVKMEEIVKAKNRTLYNNPEELFLQGPIEFVQQIHPHDVYERLKLIHDYRGLIPKMPLEIKLALYDYVKDLPEAISEQVMGKDGHLCYFEVLTTIYPYIRGQRRGLFREMQSYFLKYCIPYVSDNYISHITIQAVKNWKVLILSLPSRLIAKLRPQKS